MFEADSGFFHVRLLEVRPWMKRTVVAPLSLTPPIEKWCVVSQPAGPLAGSAAGTASAVARPSAAAAARTVANVFIGLPLLSDFLWPTRYCPAAAVATGLKSPQGPIAAPVAAA